ncbi:DUF445 domain-containing protein [Citricoccus muralis]|uniref:DUF445 domain-containing protein n=1 Tax=Citricoccus muralis TaxID=169134 RepID=A0ABY8H8B1_9MICC|nr:DUF445 domain-containing protein [Citricoccus muralis]WFP16847.1 DUF445 domain-containing protein [Citricoccus muralis]
MTLTPASPATGSPAPALASGAAVTDEQRAAALKRMKLVATSVLVVLAVIFVIAFIYEDRYPWLGYVRAGAEGGMVGALADWFAVTALFRHPMGLPIPHTAIIPRKKDQLGESLGSFFQQNFLESEVMDERLSSLRLAEKVGGWLSTEENSTRVGAEAAQAASGVLRATDDDVVQDVISTLVRDHVVAPEWSPTLSALLQNVIDAGHHRPAFELALDRATDWVRANQDLFISAVRSRSPQWIPDVVDRKLGERIHTEALNYLRAVKRDEHHELRRSVDTWLHGFAADLTDDTDLRAKVEKLKVSLFNDPRLAELASQAWATAKAGLLEQLASPTSDLHHALVSAIRDLGVRLQTDAQLAERVDTMVQQAAHWAANNYGPVLVDIIGETIHRWDGKQAARTIELFAGRDLQFIRINGSIVGALAGVTIYTLAHLLLG